ncbi:MAG: ribonuclease P protein component [Fimbriimonadaceae bacterium]|nr:ribonuclease P protein component [Fimbriimonadaceae bacterium]
MPASRFQLIVQKGRVIRTPVARLFFLPGEGRIGIGVSRHIGCHAQRNRVRRRVREAVNATASSQMQYQDLVVIVGPDGGSLALKEWKQILEPLWHGISATSVFEAESP